MRKKLFQQYGIHTILFAHTDATPWGRAFVSDILSDPSWKLIFINSSDFVMSDRTSLPDIRGNTEFIQGLIDETDDPFALLRYASLLSRLNQDNLTNVVIEKLKRVNPSSCTVKRIDYAMQNSPVYALSGPMEDRPWWCY